MIRHYFAYAFMVLSVGSCLWSQADPSAAEPPTAEAAKPSLLIMGLRLANDFDNSAQGDNRDQQHNVATMVAPELSWAGTRSRVKWALRYRPGFAMTYQLPTYELQTQLFAADLESNLTKRLTVGISGNFLQSSNSFDRLREIEFTPASDQLSTANDSTLPPTARRISKQATLDMTFALGRFSAVRLSGACSQLNYGSLALAQPLSGYIHNANSTSGQFSYRRQISRHSWTGVEYSLQKLVWSSRPSSFVHSIFYAHKISFTPATTVSIFAGPQRRVMTQASVAGTPFAGGAETFASSWHWAGGATYEWKGTHTKLVGSLSQRISDGIVLGAVSLSSVSLELRRELTRRWTADLQLTYQRNKALSLRAGALSYAAGAAGLTRVLGPNLSLDLRYWRIEQWGGGVLGATEGANGHRISAALVYTFAHPLGK